MSIHTLPKAKAQAGFTLVELAIGMIIIGLLIAGVLKGQALIANAQVTATVAQVKGYRSGDDDVSRRHLGPACSPAILDRLGGTTQPSARLPNCAAAPCNIPGNLVMVR